MPKKHIHFIGIGGTAMASLAVAFKRAGFKITGSEPKKVFPPMSDILKKSGIEYYYPFSEKKLQKLVSPETQIVIGNAHVSDTNVEANFAKKEKIELIHFPAIVEQYLIKKNSIVVSGTYAKSTITAMTAHIFKSADRDINFMLGAVPKNFSGGASLSKSNWSIVEGDEYPAASPWDFSPKFNYYHPRYLILSSATWDHMDIYKTEKSYLDVFKKLSKEVPKDGLIVAKQGGENLDKVLKNFGGKKVFYSGSKGQNKKTNNTDTIYSVGGVKTIQDKSTFSLLRNNQEIARFDTGQIGDFNLENWTAAIALCLELKLPLQKIKQAVKSFKGVKRRLEIRGVKNNVMVIDDFAHNPSKSKQAVKALAKHFEGSRLFIVFEPNRGGRSVKCLKEYQDSFSPAHKIFIPKLTEYKKKEGVVDVSGRQLANFLKKHNQHVVYQPNAEKMLGLLKKQAKPGDIIAFMGSRDFDSLIKELL